jgi:hypothetical protein
MFKKSILFALALCLYGQGLFGSALFKRVPAATTGVRSFRSALGTPEVASQLHHIAKPAKQLYTPEVSRPKSPATTYRKSPSSLSESAIQASSTQQVAYKSPKTSFPKEANPSFKPITLSDLKDADIAALKKQNKEELSSLAQNSHSQIKTVQSDYEKAMAENARLKAELEKTSAKLAKTKDKHAKATKMISQLKPVNSALIDDFSKLSTQNKRLIESSQGRTKTTVTALQKRDQQLAAKAKEKQTLEDKLAKQEAQHEQKLQAQATTHSDILTQFDEHSTSALSTLKDIAQQTLKEQQAKHLAEKQALQAQISNLQQEKSIATRALSAQNNYISTLKNISGEKSALLKKANETNQNTIKVKTNRTSELRASAISKNG